MNIRSILAWGLPGVFIFALALALATDANARVLPDQVPADRQADLREALAEMAHPITLADGTRCVVFYARHEYSGSGGITCDWSTAPHRQNENQRP